MRARSLAMPSSVILPCSWSAMGGPPSWGGILRAARRRARQRTEQAEDGGGEEPLLHLQGARGEWLVAPAGEPAQRGGIQEVREDHAEEGDAEVGHLLRLPAGVARHLADDGDALAVERAEPLVEQRLHGARVLEERALEEARQVGMARQVLGQALEGGL